MPPTSPPAEGPIVAVGTASKPGDLPPGDRPAAPPKAVADKLRLRQNLKEGKTYETLIRGTVYSRGDDRAWGLKTIVWINYAFEARVDREIVSNDGEAIVEKRHFRDVRSLKLDVELEDVKLDVSGVRTPIMALATLVWPKAALVVRSFDGASLKPIMGLLRSLGLRPELLTGHDREAVRVFTQYDSLQGKSVEIEFRDGQGVTQVVPLVGAMTRSERFIHHHSVLASDSLIFPNPDVAEGGTWVRFIVDNGSVLPGIRVTLERPVLKDVKIKQKGGGVEHWPLIELDLCIGERSINAALSFHYEDIK